MVLPACRNGVARASFAELCTRPLGPADFLAIAAAVEVLILDDVPLLSRARNNEAKRFVTLVDALYEAKVRLVCSAAAAAGRALPGGRGAVRVRPYRLAAARDAGGRPGAADASPAVARTRSCRVGVAMAPLNPGRCDGWPRRFGPFAACAARPSGPGWPPLPSVPRRIPGRPEGALAAPPLDPPAPPDRFEGRRRQPGSGVRQGWLEVTRARPGRETAVRPRGGANAGRVPYRSKRFTQRRCSQ